MVKDKLLLEKFEREQIKNNKPDFFKNLMIFEELYKEALHLGILSLENPLEGIEADLRLAKIINNV